MHKHQAKYGITVRSKRNNAVHGHEVFTGTSTLPRCRLWARATYLRNVLVEHLGQVRSTINILPGEGKREVCVLHVCMRQRQVEVLKRVMARHNLQLREALFDDLRQAMTRAKSRL